MLKKSFLLLAFIFFIIIAQAQSQDSIGKKNRFIRSFRINYNYNYYDDFYRVRFGNYYNPNSLIGNIGLGYSLKSRKNFNSHDIEVSNLRSFLNTSGTNGQGITLRYQYNYFFIKRNNISFSPYLGISYLCDFYRSRSVRKSGAQKYHYTHYEIANQFVIVPGIQYKLSERVYFDLSVPINIFRGSLVQFKYMEHPEYNTTQSYSDQFSFFNKNYYNIRLGVGIIMNPEIRKKEADLKYVKTIKFNFNESNYFYKNFDNAYAYLSGLAPVITFQNIRTRNMHEIELTEIAGTFQRDRKNYSISVRYQFDYFFIKKPSLFAPYFGVSTLVNYQRRDNKETLPNYEQRSSFLYYTFAAVPGVQFYPCSKFYFDISLPINVWAGALGYSKTEDPSLPQYNYSGMYGEWQKRYHYWNLRIGIGFKL